MDGMGKSKTKKEAKRKMSGWIIALIVVAAVFLAGAICCNTIGKAQNDRNIQSSSVDTDKKQQHCQDVQ